MNGLRNDTGAKESTSETRRLQLTFSLSSPIQRQAWELIQSIPRGERTRKICELLCGGRDNSVTLGEIRTIIREELQRVSITNPDNSNPDKQGEPEGGEIADEFLDFLSSLNMGGDSD